MEKGKIGDYLAQEYLFLEKAVDDFHTRALTIKAWSVTFSTAALGLAYYQDEPLLLLFASASALVFWGLETVRKYHQRAHYPRILAIEEWFAREAGQAGESGEARAAELAPFQIMNSWESEFWPGLKKRIIQDRKTGQPRRFAVPFYAGVMLPHIIVVAAGILLYIFLRPEPGAAGPDAKPPPPSAGQR